jgi:hypothetical protein
MQHSSRRLNKLEALVNGTNLGDKFPYHVNQRDWAKVLEGFHLRRLRHQHHEGVIGSVEVMEIHMPESV